MATQLQAVASAPVDLVAELSLADCTAYLLQVTGVRAARLAEAAAAPSDRAASHEILPGETWTVTASATPLWCWCDAADPATAVTVTEAA